MHYKTPLGISRFAGVLPAAVAAVVSLLALQSGGDSACKVGVLHKLGNIRPPRLLPGDAVDYPGIG